MTFASSNTGLCMVRLVGSALSLSDLFAHNPWLLTNFAYHRSSAIGGQKTAAPQVEWRIAALNSCGVVAVNDACLTTYLYGPFYRSTVAHVRLLIVPSSAGFWMVADRWKRPGASPGTLKIFCGIIIPQIATSERDYRQSTPNILKLGLLESLEISVFSM